MLLSRVERAGRDRARRAGDDRQGLRLRATRRRRRDGAAAGGRRASRSTLPPEEALEGRARLAVHALPGLPRVARRRSSASCTCATSSPRVHDRGIAEVRHRARSCARRTSSPRRRISPRCCRSSGKTNQHMAVVVDEYGAHGGDRHARGPARGDRRRDRGRVRPAGGVDRADRRRHDPHRRHVPDRRLQRAVRHRARRTRTTTRSPASSSAQLGRAPRPGDEVDDRRPALRVLEIEGSRIERLEVEFPEARPEPDEPDG